MYYTTLAALIIPCLKSMFENMNLVKKRCFSLFLLCFQQ